MKLFGGNRNSKHTRGHVPDTSAGRAGSHAKSRTKKKGGWFKKFIIIFFALIAALGIAAAAFWMTQVKAPDVSGKKKNDPTNKESSESTEPVKPGKKKDGGKKDGGDEDGDGEKYTFLILGTDDGNGNTDTIMTATFDTSDYTMNVVSIPRDTLVNVSWSTKKVNSLYGVGGIDRVKDGIADLLGYEVDFYAIIDLDAFVKLIDAIGGVTYDVPMDMKYSDPYQDLYINLSKGTQTLSGSKAVGLMRFRKGYADADIGRINTQQDFLKTVASQLLSKVDEVPISTLVDVVVNEVKTDIPSGNLIWFAKEFLKMDAEKISFHTMPGNYGDACYHGGQWNSYVTIYVDEWIEMINEYLNPLDEPIEVSDLDIYTRNSSGKLYTTTGVFAGDPSWGYKSGSSSGGSQSGGSSSGSGSGSGGTTQKPSGNGTGSGGQNTQTPGQSGTTTGTDEPTGEVNEQPDNTGENTEEPTGETPEEGVGENTEEPGEPDEPEENVPTDTGEETGAGTGEEIGTGTGSGENTEEPAENNGEETAE